MSLETAFCTLREALRAKIPAVIFIGGEGILDKNFYKYLEYCKNNSIIAQYASNGILLNKETIQKLKYYGLRQVCVTIHDSLPVRHNAIVGVPGALEKVLNAFRIMKQEGFSVSCKTIYSKESIRSGAFFRVLELARSEGIIFSANPYLPVGGAVDPETRLSEAEIQEYYRICRENDVKDHIYNGWYVGCPAGKTYFGVLPDGQLLPCYFLPISVGNIKTHGFREAMKICARIPLFAKRHMVCPVVQSESLYKEIIQPLYANNSLKLPVDITQDQEMFNKLAGFTL